MEFRALKYFLAVAKTGNITHAADQVFVSQPALSRQLMDLEEDLGVKLLERGKRHTALTEAGYLLKKRAEEIMALMDKTVDELSHAREGVSGSVRIGCGETEGMRTVARAIHDIRREYPHVRCHLSSMDGSGVRERLDKGMLDFGVLVQPDPPNDYEHVEIGHTDRWGILMRRDSPLAALERIAPGDLAGQPLVISSRPLKGMSWYPGSPGRKANWTSRPPAPSSTTPRCLRRKAWAACSPSTACSICRRTGRSCSAPFSQSASAGSFLCGRGTRCFPGRLPCSRKGSSRPRIMVDLSFPRCLCVPCMDIFRKMADHRVPRPMR